MTERLSFSYAAEEKNQQRNTNDNVKDDDKDREKTAKFKMLLQDSSISGGGMSRTNEKQIFLLKIEEIFAENKSWALIDLKYLP